MIADRTGGRRGRSIPIKSRTAKNGYSMCVFYVFLSFRFVDLFITLCIVINTVFMAMEHDNMAHTLSETLRYGNYVREVKYLSVKIYLYLYLIIAYILLLLLLHIYFYCYCYYCIYIVIVIIIIAYILLLI